jgi:hypothetical protein
VSCKSGWPKNDRGKKIIRNKTEAIDGNKKDASVLRLNFMVELRRSGFGGEPALFPCGGSTPLFYGLQSSVTFLRGPIIQRKAKVSECLLACQIGTHFGRFWSENQIVFKERCL